MSLAIKVFPVMPTRPCSFCLSLQDGSVFADFDTNEADVVRLRRISFDGFGCCSVDDSITSMSSSDSRLLLDAIGRGDLSSIHVEDALQRYFRANKDVLWSDALVEYGLL